MNFYTMLEKVKARNLLLISYEYQKKEAYFQTLKTIENIFNGFTPPFTYLMVVGRRGAQSFHIQQILEFFGPNIDSFIEKIETLISTNENNFNMYQGYDYQMLQIIAEDVDIEFVLGLMQCYYQNLSGDKILGLSSDLMINPKIEERLELMLTTALDLPLINPKYTYNKNIASLLQQHELFNILDQLQTAILDYKDLIGEDKFIKDPNLISLFKKNNKLLTILNDSYKGALYNFNKNLYVLLMGLHSKIIQCIQPTGLYNTIQCLPIHSRTIANARARVLQLHSAMQQFIDLAPFRSSGIKLSVESTKAIQSLSFTKRYDIEKNAAMRIQQSWRNRYQNTYGPFMLDRTIIPKSSHDTRHKLFHMKIPGEREIVDKNIRLTAYNTGNYFDLLCNTSEFLIKHMLFDVEKVFSKIEISRFVERVVKTDFILKHYSKIDIDWLKNTERYTPVGRQTLFPSKLLSLRELYKHYETVSNNSSDDSSLNNDGFVYFHLQPSGFDKTIQSRFGHIEYCTNLDNTSVMTQGYMSVTEQLNDVFKDTAGLLQNSIIRNNTDADEIKKGLREICGEDSPKVSYYDDESNSIKTTDEVAMNFQNIWEYPLTGEKRMRLLLEEGFFGLYIKEGIAYTLLRELALMGIKRLNKQFVTLADFTDENLGELMQALCRFEIHLPSNVTVDLSKFHVTEYDTIEKPWTIIKSHGIVSGSVAKF